MGEAIVEFEYIAQEEDELNLKVGDVITNITKTSEGWCEGSLNGRRGMFPDNFVKIQESKKEAKLPAKRQNSSSVHEMKLKLNSVILPGNIPPSLAAKKPPKRAKVTFAYTAQQDDELALEVGNVIEILKQEDPNWWEGSLNGKAGMFPSNFVEIIGQVDGEKQGADEVPEIRGRKVEGVGFGNIFAGGQIVLRSKGEKKDATEVPKDIKPPQIKLKPAVPTSAVQPNMGISQPLKANTKPVLRARVTYPYTAANDDELDLADGDVIVILDQNLEDDGWWKGELNGKVGVFPDNFVELLPVESEKPARPVIPPLPSATSMGGAKTTGNALPIDPLKAKLVKTSPPVRPPELNQVHETDDNKAKKNKDAVRTGTMDSLKPSETALSHPTAFRARPPARRPPAPGHSPVRDAPTSDEKLASVAKVQPQVPLKEDQLQNPQKLHREATEYPSASYVTHEQYVELQREVAQLRAALEQTRKSQDKRFRDLVAEIDEEKKVRLNLQVEVERLKKMVMGQ